MCPETMFLGDGEPYRLLKFLGTCMGNATVTATPSQDAHGTPHLLMSIASFVVQEFAL